MQKLIQNRRMNCVFRKFVQENTFSQNCPTLLVPPFSRQGFGVSILTYVFSSRDLLSHSFVRFLHELCVCDIGSCLVLSKWVDGAKISHAVQVVGNDNIFLQFIDKGILLLKKIPDEDFFTTSSGIKIL